MSDARIDRTLTTNLHGMLWLTRAALPHMGAGSCVINVSSIQVYEPSTTLLDYAAAKSAINNFTVTLAAQAPALVSSLARARRRTSPAPSSV